MGNKVQNIYKALINGAEDRLSGDNLFRHVLEECPKATSKKIVRAALLALSDPDVKDKNILHVVFALAIKHRLDPLKGNGIETPNEEVKPKRSNKGTKKAGPALTPPSE